MVIMKTQELDNARRAPINAHSVMALQIQNVTPALSKAFHLGRILVQPVIRSAMDALVH